MDVRQVPREQAHRLQCYHEIDISLQRVRHGRNSLNRFDTSQGRVVSLAEKGVTCFVENLCNPTCSKELRNPVGTVKNGGLTTTSHMEVEYSSSRRTIQLAALLSLDGPSHVES